MRLNGLCPKCNGSLYVNVDKDLSCLTCGKSIALRRAIDGNQNSRQGQRRPDKKVGGGGNIYRVSKVPTKALRSKNTPNYRNEMDNQRSIRRTRRPF